MSSVVKIRPVEQVADKPDWAIGKCPWCGTDLPLRMDVGTSVTCPECGGGAILDLRTMMLVAFEENQDAHYGTG